MIGPEHVGELVVGVAPFVVQKTVADGTDEVMMTVCGVV
jgi:hypothetical protein